MIRKNPSGDLPDIHESAYVDNTAILCGKNIRRKNVFIGPYAVIRADEVDEDGNHSGPLRITPRSLPSKLPLSHYNASHMQNPNPDLRTFSISIPETQKSHPEEWLSARIRWLPDLDSNQGPAD